MWRFLRGTRGTVRLTGSARCAPHFILQHAHASSTFGSLTPFFRLRDVWLSCAMTLLCRALESCTGVLHMLSTWARSLHWALASSGRISDAAGCWIRAEIVNRNQQPTFDNLSTAFAGRYNPLSP